MRYPAMLLFARYAVLPDTDGKYFIQGDDGQQRGKPQACAANLVFDVKQCLCKRPELIAGPPSVEE